MPVAELLQVLRALAEGKAYFQELQTEILEIGEDCLEETKALRDSNDEVRKELERMSRELAYMKGRLDTFAETVASKKGK